MTRDEATREAARRDFRFLDPALAGEGGALNVGKLARATGKLFEALRRSEAKGYATCIQPEDITNLTCKVEGEVARGEVSFKAEGLYEGRVGYVARKGEKGWWIEEFVLPGYKLRLSRKSPADKWVRSDAGE